MFLRVACLLILGLLLPTPSTAEGPQELTPASWNTVGERVPEVELPRIDGRGTVDLGTLRGRKLLLIHFASW